MKNYNITQLHPESAFKNHVFHRDMFAHYLRWTHVLKLIKPGQTVLDFGCGNGNLYATLYHNMHVPGKFVGLDVRKQTIERNRVKHPKAIWEVQDLVNIDQGFGTNWDFITSFEVAEHVGRSNVPKFLDNIKDHCNPETVVLLSTPCYDEKVGAADNHTYDCGDGRGVASQELTRDEMKNLLDQRFKVIASYGTFASIKDYKDKLTTSELEVFEKLSKYYDLNLTSVIFAPLVPEHSRNNLWVCQLK